jgi:excisionase family DNA binding protein
MNNSNFHASDHDDRPATDADMLTEGLLTVYDAARFLAVGKTTLYGAMDRGDLLYVKLGRARRIPRRALLAFAQAGIRGGWAMQPQSQSGCAPEVVETK